MPLYKDLRPSRVEDIIGQDEVIREVTTVINRCKATGETLPDMLFEGPPGVGKTTLALAVIRLWYGDSYRSSYIELNASDDRGIDVVRDRIKPITMIRGHRTVLIDEGDKMTEDAQMAFRRIMETSKSTNFIITANEPWRIIEPIQSRCAIFNFRPLSTRDMQRVIVSVCREKGINFETTSVEEQRQLRDGLEALVKEGHGDVRKSLNILEKVISERKTISVKDVVKYSQPNLIPQILKTALAGDIEKAIQQFEDAFILSKYNTSEMIISFYTTIRTEVLDPELKARLLLELARTEDRIRHGNNPLIQFGAFCAFLWVSPHLKGVIHTS